MEEGGEHHLKGSQASPACPFGSMEMYERTLEWCTAAAA